MGTLRGHAELVRLAIATTGTLAVGGAVSALVVSSLAVATDVSRVVGAVEVGVVVRILVRRLLLRMRGLAGLLLSLGGGGRVGRVAAAVLGVAGRSGSGAETVSGALGILAQVIALGAVAESTLLTLRRGILLSLRTLLAVGLVVVAVVRVAALVVRSVVGGVIVGRRAEGSARLLLALRLRRSLLVLVSSVELALSSAWLLLSERVVRLRSGEGTLFLGSLAKTTILLGALGRRLGSYTRDS